jgi:hypothetical protein
VCFSIELALRSNQPGFMIHKTGGRKRRDSRFCAYSILSCRRRVSSSLSKHDKMSLDGASPSSSIKKA